MKVIELKEALEGLPDEAEVRLAMQPSWPFEYSIGDVIPLEPIEEELDEEEKRDDDPEFDDTIKVVYLTEGSQLGYLPGNATEAIGW
jgi:hypothetical protein